MSKLVNFAEIIFNEKYLARVRFPKIFLVQSMAKYGWRKNSEPLWVIEFGTCGFNSKKQVDREVHARKLVLENATSRNIVDLYNVDSKMVRPKYAALTGSARGLAYPLAVMINQELHDHMIPVVILKWITEAEKEALYDKIR